MSKRQVLISTDGHAGADLLDYKPYLERRWHDEFDAWAATFRDAWVEENDQDRPANQRLGVASAGAPLNWDGPLRLSHLDEQGIAAEVLFPNTSPPFYPSGALTSPGPRTSEEFEQRFAGLRAHNRWMADFCSQEPDRWAGFAQVFLDDVDAAIAEVRWAKEAGLKGVLLPADHVLKLSNLYYPHLDPLWAACAEVGLPIHRHASFPTESVHEGGDASALVGMVETQFFSIRTLGHLILSGAFERHPDLVFVLTEITAAAELPGYLARLDGLAGLGLGTGTPLYEHIKDALAVLQRKPSEYFATNCFVAGPTHDLRAAHDLGTPNLMWGADVPHAEGTSPYTLEVLRTTMSDLPADDITALLSTRAAEVYDLDLGRLEAVADRIGPTLDEITTPLPPEDRPRFPEDTRCTVFLTR
ncbi:MAG: amidohydrolase [Acidimicrobiia bacterium]|nr:amidohydrolase [Acidimicrobiia bacterium]